SLATGGGPGAPPGGAPADAHTQAPSLSLPRWGRTPPGAGRPRGMGWLIVDGHEDIATEFLETGRDFAAPAPEGHALSLPDAKRGGVGVILATIFAPDGYWKGETATDAAERQMLFYER